MKTLEDFMKKFVVALILNGMFVICCQKITFYIIDSLTAYSNTLRDKFLRFWTSAF
jgi:hypothetical protein